MMASRKARPHPKRIRLLALDIDDTLTGPDGRIGRPNHDAIKWAQDSGVLVTLVTGRRYLSSAQRFADDIELDGMIGCHYGRALVMHPQGQFVTAHHLGPEIAARVLALAHEWQLAPSVCANETIFFPDTDKYGPRLSVEGTNLPRVAWVPDLDQVLASHGDQIMSMALSGPNAERIRGAFATEIDGGLLTVYDQRGSGRGDKLAVLLAGRENKGTALRAICGNLGVAASETVAMGDSEADIPLMRAAGYGIAMPWADDHVREAADRVAEGGAEDAVAREICRLLGCARR